MIIRAEDNPGLIRFRLSSQIKIHFRSFQVPATDKTRVSRTGKSLCETPPSSSLYPRLLAYSSSTGTPTDTETGELFGPETNRKSRQIYELFLKLDKVLLRLILYSVFFQCIKPLVLKVYAFGGDPSPRQTS